MKFSEILFVRKYVPDLFIKTKSKSVSEEKQAPLVCEVKNFSVEFEWHLHLYEHSKTVII